MNALQTYYKHITTLNDMTEYHNYLFEIGSYYYSAYTQGG